MQTEAVCGSRLRACVHEKKQTTFAAGRNEHLFLAMWEPSCISLDRFEAILGPCWVFLGLGHLGSISDDLGTVKDNLAETEERSEA